jgi:hypothetical protein
MVQQVVVEQVEQEVMLHGQTQVQAVEQVLPQR